MCALLKHASLCLCLHFFLQAFPLIPAPGGENPGFTECARYHLAARPRKGDGEYGAVFIRKHWLQSVLESAEVDSIPRPRYTYTMGVH
jgi:hypothetical protein